MSVKLYQGSPLMIDRTPGSAKSGGDVEVAGAVCLVYLNDVAASALGAAMFPAGTTVLDANLKSGDTPAFMAKLYWDDSNDEVTTTSTSNTFIGFCLSYSGGRVYLVHTHNLVDT